MKNNWEASPQIGEQNTGENQEPKRRSWVGRVQNLGNVALLKEGTWQIDSEVLDELTSIIRTEVEKKRSYGYLRLRQHDCYTATVGPESGISLN